MSFSRKLICIILLSLTAVLAAVSVSYAREYDVGGTEWDDGDEGHIYITWDGCEEKTSYYVILCKEGHVYYYTSGKNKGKVKDKSGEKSIKESVCKWRKTSGTRVDFGPEMAEFGTGKYYCLIVPEKMYPDKDKLPYDAFPKDKTVKYVDPMYGIRSYCEKSEIYTLSSEDRGTLSKSVKNAEKEALDSITYTPGWIGGLGGNWMYAGQDGKLYKNQWVDDKGKRYYIGADNIMVKGWAAISGKYYFFGDDGALLVNTTTPDGYKVDAEGVWIQDGKQVPSSEYKKYNKSSLSLKIVEDPDVRGVIKPISIPDGKEYTITNIRYNIDPSQWIVGNAVIIYLNVNAAPEYAFENNIKITCSQGTVVSNKGDSKTRNLEIRYIPRIKLQTPEVVIDEDGMMRWNPIERAKKYNIKITDDEGNHSVSVTTNKYDLGDYITGSAIDGLAVSVKVSAANGTNRYIQESDAFVIDELEDFIHNHSSEGRLKQSGLNTYYIQGDSEKATGWIQHEGFWYYFDEKKNGKAIKNAWFEDKETGKWYYFDNDGHMLVNTTTPDGCQVGADGAWIQQ